MSKKKIIIICTITILIIAYFVFKLFCINAVYSSNDDLSNLNNITNPITIHKSNSDKEYLTFKNIQIANYFSDFEDQSSNEEIDNNLTENEKRIAELLESKHLILRSENNTSAVTITKSLTILEGIKNNTDIFGQPLPYSNIINFQKIIKKHNINSDLEFISLLGNKEKMKLNIFSSFKKIIEVSTLKQIGATNAHNIESITPIQGDYNGYILNMNYIKEVKIINDNYSYNLVFSNLEYFNDELIHEIISTLIIN